jgi:DNA-directed RNA polymerase subunit beta
MGKHLRCVNDLGEVLQRVKNTSKILCRRFCLLQGQWVADDSTNKMVNELIHNYKIKLNDLQRH